MLKKGLIVTFIIVTVLKVTAFAGAFYVAPSLLFESLSAGQLVYEGVAPRLTLGYGDIVYDDRWYLGGEIFGSPRYMQLLRNSKNGQDIKADYELGASLLPGLFLDDIIMAYVRLGIVSLRFKDLDITRHGTQIGVGLEGWLSEKWSVRGEYDYNRYRKINGIGTPTSGNYLISAVYRFAFV